MIMLKPMVRLVSFVFNRNCSAMMLEVRTVGMAASKIVILAISPFMPIRSAHPSVMTGARMSLYSIETDIWGISFFQPLNFNCNPTENNANGLTVAANLSKKGSAQLKSINWDNTNAEIQPINGGKVISLFRINFALTFPEVLPPFTAAIIPNVDSAKNIVWSQITATLNKLSP